MPRFYLHVCNGNGLTEDDEGHELPGLEAAREFAIKSARDVMAAEMRDGLLNLASFIEVEDEARKHLLTVPFEEAFRIVREPHC
jgi:hypothetical protein